MGPKPDGSPMVVVEAGRFTWCPGDRNDVITMPLADVIELLGPDLSVEDRNRCVDPAGVMPGRAVATVLRGGGLETFVDELGRSVRLGQDHVRALAVVDGPISTAALSERSELAPERCAAAVEDLVAVGALVSVTPPEETPRAAASGPVASERSAVVAAPSSPRWISLVRRRVAGARSRRSTRRTSSASDTRVGPGVEPSSDGAGATRDDTAQDDRRVTVHSFWATPQGPHMGAASVVAFARVHGGGRLNAYYDLRQVRPAEVVLSELSSNPGPAVLLCSDYLWSIGANMEVARRAHDLVADLVVVHGGPSAPRQEADCRRFLADLPDGHVVVSGEGEVTFAEVLSRLADGWEPGGSPDLSVLTGVAGVSFRHPDGTLVVNPPRTSHTELEDFPSPLLSGEFDLVPLDVIRRVSVPVETVRGCPFGCTFCDWGQATMTRIRKFPLERIFGDLGWLADRGVSFWVIADANWGMLPRDLQVAEHIAELHRRTGFPHFVGAGPPKNSTDRYVSIMDTLLTAGVSLKAAIALQTRDQVTLDAVHRSNIKTSTYDRITEEMRRRGLPLHCELMLGLPGSTVESLKADLQWCVEENVRPHVYRTFVLPNAPMNDPTYKAEHGIEVEGGMLVATESYDRAAGDLMWRIAYAFQALEFLGLARYTLRLLEWDHGLRVIDVIHRILEAVDREPDRYPLMAFVLRHFEQFIVPPAGWAPFYDELHDLLVTELGVEDDSGLLVALVVDRHTMPWPGRRPPYSVELDHDYVEWFAASNRRTRWSEGRPRSGRPPLVSYPPGRLEILADPDGVSEVGLGRQVEADSEVFPGFITAFWEVCHLELLSQLTVYEPMSHRFVAEARRRLPGRDTGPLQDSTRSDPAAEATDAPQPVVLRPRR